MCDCLSNYTLMNIVLLLAGVPHSSGFKPEEQTATLLRPSGTEQNTNVHRRQRESDRQRDEGSGEGGRGSECERKNTGGNVKD